jgi:hypothetical protein
MQTLSCFMYNMNYRRHTIQSSILKDDMFECGDHLQNIHDPLTFQFWNKTLFQIQNPALIKSLKLKI